MPDHEISTSQERGGIGSRSRIRRTSLRGSHADGYAQSTRANSTVSQMAAPHQSRSVVEYASSSSRIPGSCRPISVKRIALSMKVTISHADSPSSRTSGVVSSGVCQPR
jgi:hypothetical protein